MEQTDVAVAIPEAAAAVKAMQPAKRPTRLPLPPRFVLGRVPVDRISMDYAAILLAEALLHPGELPTLTVVGPNAQLITLSQKDELFAEALQQADLSVPDGMSVVLASKLLGVPIPERVTGGDLMERMCAESAHYGFRVFFLGGLPGAAEMAAFNLRRRYPGLNICGTYCPPFGFENDPAELFWIEKVVEEARPDLLCVAFGAPKQEIWMQRHRGRLHVGVILPVGAAFDTQAGLQRRAPQWMQRNALEWLFRLMMEPRRLWRRYLVGNTCFIFLVLRQWARQKNAAWQRRFLRRTSVNHEQTAGD
jgi:N-acetylglucosaminyldiphosphoundecaprenol N-acetyl-beta-D-mannosaminyltransferase